MKHQKCITSFAAARVWLTVCLLALLAYVQPTEAQSPPPLLFSFTGVNAGDKLGSALQCLKNFHASNAYALAVGIPNGSGGGQVIFYDGTGAPLPIALAPLSSFSRRGIALAAGTDLTVGAGSFFDLIVGSPSTSPPNFPSIAEIVGGPDGSSIVQLTASGSTSASVGASVALYQGDLDANGVPDIVIGAPDTAMSGAVAITDRAATSPIREFPGTQTFGGFGTTVASIYDLDADGDRDLIVGSPFATGSIANSGTIDAISAQDGLGIWQLSGDNSGDRFGDSLAVVYDLTGAGSPAGLLVGAPSASVAPGYVRLFSVPRSGSVPTAVCTLTGAANGDRFGFSVAALGDLDGDGNQEFAVGAPAVSSNTGQVNVYTYFVSTGVCALKYSLNGVAPGDRFGISLTGLILPGIPCDLNGDGVPDFAVGSDLSDQRGKTTAFSGLPPTPTPTVTPTFTPTSTPTPIVTPTRTAAPTTTALPTATPSGGRTPSPTPTIAGLPTSATMSFRINQVGQLVITNSLDGAGHSPIACAVSIYGRTSRADLSDVRDVFVVARRLPQRVRALRVSLEGLHQATCDLDGHAYSIHLITDNRCGSKRFFSNVFARQTTCGLLPPLRRPEWELQLQNVTFSSAARRTGRREIRLRH